MLIDLPKLPPPPNRESRHVKGTEERRRAAAALANKVEGRQAIVNGRFALYCLWFE